MLLLQDLVDVRAQAQITVHGEGREADIDAVDIAEGCKAGNNKAPTSNKLYAWSSVHAAVSIGFPPGGRSRPLPVESA